MSFTQPNEPSITIGILTFLWRWKLATTAGLHVHFSPQSSGYAFYLRLWKLKQKHWIQMKPGKNHRDNFWILTKEGFQIIRELLPPMQEEGFQSEYATHDLLTSAIHLGDGIFGPVDGLDFFTEQELRRMDPDCFPQWVPPCLGHRPDGYWLSSQPDGQRTIALEMELHSKATRNYESAVSYYSDMTDIHRVLWVTATPGLAKSIHKIAAASSYTDIKHNFILLPAVQKEGWNASIFLGPDTRKTVYQLLEKARKKETKTFFPTFSLDARRTPYISPCSRIFTSDPSSY